jgi:hypothetical protein
VKVFLGKMGRFFWSWSSLKFLLWSITLIVFFYAEEDWRGARAWAATKAKWEARGESFDYTKFDPAPVPEAENLSALPIFKVDPVSHQPEVLLKAMRGSPIDNYPKVGNFMQSVPPDLDAIQAALLKDYSAAFPSTPPPPDPLAQFEQLYPFIADLRAATATRPFCRFDGDYAIYPPENRALSSIVDQLKLSRLVVLHALLALHQNQTDLALADLKLNYRLAAGTERDPSLVGGLVANGIEAMSDNVVNEGLARHAWNDAQLAEIQERLGRFDLLRNFQFYMRGEAAGIGLNYDFFKNNRQLSLANWQAAEGMTGIKLMVLKLSMLWPSGWIDHNKGPVVDSLLNDLTIVAPEQHRVYPDIAIDLDRKLEHRLAELDTVAPWNFISIDAGFAITGPAQGFARNQVIVLDEARLACALERYCLAHGVYPETLDTLAPTCIDSVPHDIMNGEPYHYRLRPEGTFLLYSVGWNQRDDGGKTVFQKQAPTKVDYAVGDWVWPQPRLAR